MNSKKDNRYCIYSKGEFIIEKHIYLDTQERFDFLCNNTYVMIKASYIVPLQFVCLTYLHMVLN